MSAELARLLDSLVEASRKREHSEHFGRHGDGTPEKYDRLILDVRRRIHAHVRRTERTTP